MKRNIYTGSELSTKPFSVSNRYHSSPLFENELYTRPYITITSSGFFPIHYHRHIEFVCVTQGKMGVQIYGQKHILCEGDSMLVSPYEIHGYSPESSERPVLFKAIMDPECIGTPGELLLDYRPENPIVHSGELKKIYPNLPEKLIRMSQGFSTDASDVDYAKNYSEFILFLTDFLLLSGIGKSVISSNKHYIRAVRLCCDSFTDCKLNIDTIAEKTEISRSRLQQLFFENLHLGVKEYITLLRMNKAEIALCETSENISKISEECGYETVRSFNRAFSGFHKITPTEYRNMYRKNFSIENTRKVLSNFDLFYENIK